MRARMLLALLALAPAACSLLYDGYDRKFVQPTAPADAGLERLHSNKTIAAFALCNDTFYVAEGAGSSADTVVALDATSSDAGSSTLYQGTAGAFVRAIACDDAGAAFWIVGGAARSQVMGTTGVLEVAEAGDYLSTLAADPAGVFWSRVGVGVRASTLDGAVPPPLNGLALDDAAFYGGTTIVPAPGLALYRRPRQTLSPADCFWSAPGEAGVGITLARGGDELYLSTGSVVARQNTASSCCASPSGDLGACAMEILSDAGAGGIAADAIGAVWVAPGSPSETSFYFAPADGGAPHAFATIAQPGVANVVIDAQYVYFLAGDALWRIPRPAP